MIPKAIIRKDCGPDCCSKVIQSTGKSKRNIWFWSAISYPFCALNNVEFRNLTNEPIYSQLENGLKKKLNQCCRTFFISSTITVPGSTQITTYSQQKTWRLFYRFAMKFHILDPMDPYSAMFSRARHGSQVWRTGLRGSKMVINLRESYLKQWL